MNWKVLWVVVVVCGAVAILVVFYLAANHGPVTSPQALPSQSTEPETSGPPPAVEATRRPMQPEPSPSVPGDLETLPLPDPLMPVVAFRDPPSDPLLYIVEDVSTWPPQPRHYEDLSAIALKNPHAAFRLHILLATCREALAQAGDGETAKACSALTLLQLDEAERWLEIASIRGNRQALGHFAATEADTGQAIEIVDALWSEGYFHYLGELSQLWQRRYETTGDPDDQVHAFAASYLQAHLEIAALEGHQSPRTAMLRKSVSEQAEFLLPRHLADAVTLAREMLIANQSCCIRGR